MKYTVEMEISGPLAMFARPDTGSTPTSYPVPTWSACKGIFESIAMLKSGDAWICPTAVEVCRRRGGAGGTAQFQKYTTNYGGPLRKADLMRTGNRMQLFATVLGGVCYRLYGEVRGTYQQHANVKHYLQELFERRLKQGRCYRTPSLGWREFTCSYWGKFRGARWGGPLQLAFSPRPPGTGIRTQSGRLSSAAAHVVAASESSPTDVARL